MRIAVLFLAIFLAGCGSTIFKRWDATGTSVSVDAKQREILSIPADHSRFICAEPSPDALVAASSAISAGLQGGQLLDGVQAGLAASLSEVASNIGTRNATIQLLRDALYRACEARINGALSDAEYAIIMAYYPRVMITLLTIEGILQPPQAPTVTLIAGKGSASSNVTSPTEGDDQQQGDDQQPGVGGGGVDVSADAESGQVEVEVGGGSGTGPDIEAIKAAKEIVNKFNKNFAAPLIALCIGFEERAREEQRNNSSQIQADYGLGQFCGQVYAALPTIIEKALEKE